jgi:anti-sigma regulatory factor (Ser/Thr protein kinase)
LLTELQAETQGLQEQSELAFAWQIAANLPPIRTDPGKLKMVLKNLLSNAVKFTKQGSVTVEALGHEGGVEISVTDTGIGIAAEDLARIFEPFHQVESAPTRLYRGAGLGLHIVRSTRISLLINGNSACNGVSPPGNPLFLLCLRTQRVALPPSPSAAFRSWVPSREEKQIPDLAGDHGQGHGRLRGRER